MCEAVAALRAAGRSSELAAPAAALARDGVALNRQQAYVVEILERDRHLDARVRGAVRARRAGCCGAGDVLRQPELADALERLGAEGAAPFYTGDIAAAIVDWLAERGGLLTATDLRRLRGRRSRAGAGRATAGARC